MGWFDSSSDEAQCSDQVRTQQLAFTSCPDSIAVPPLADVFDTSQYVPVYTPLLSKTNISSVRYANADPHQASVSHELIGGAAGRYSCRISHI